jgi:hypothetical protein
VKETIKIRFQLSAHPNEVWQKVFDRQSTKYIYACNILTDSIDCLLTNNQFKDVLVVIEDVKKNVDKTNDEIIAELQKNVILKDSLDTGLLIVSDGLKGSDLSDYINKKKQNQSSLG